MNRRRITGKPRKYTDSQILAVREWKPLAEFCRSIGVNPRSAFYLRTYQHKQPSP